MDPNACVKRITDALRDGDIEEACDAILDLEDWLSNGGFPPSVASWCALLDELREVVGITDPDALRLALATE